MPRTPPSFDNLAVCDEHGIMMHADNHKHRCPLCHIDTEVEVRRDDDVPGHLDDHQFRNRLEAETLEELLPLMRAYLEDKQDPDEVELWITLDPYPGDSLPAGYTEAQERWVNVVGFRSGIREKYLCSTMEADATISNLREQGYGD